MAPTFQPHTRPRPSPSHHTTLQHTQNADHTAPSSSTNPRSTIVNPTAAAGAARDQSSQNPHTIRRHGLHPSNNFNPYNMSSKYDSSALKIPDGFPALLKGFAREVIRAQVRRVSELLRLGDGITSCYGSVKRLDMRGAPGWPAAGAPRSCWRALSCWRGARTMHISLNTALTLRHPLPLTHLTKTTLSPALGRVRVWRALLFTARGDGRSWGRRRGGRRRTRRRQRRTRRRRKCRWRQVIRGPGGERIRTQAHASKPV